jgi:hypothetical protein
MPDIDPDKVVREDHSSLATTGKPRNISIPRLSFREAILLLLFIASLGLIVEYGPIMLLFSLPVGYLYLSLRYSWPKRGAAAISFSRRLTGFKNSRKRKLLIGTSSALVGVTLRETLLSNIMQNDSSRNSAAELREQFYNTFKLVVNSLQDCSSKESNYGQRVFARVLDSKLPIERYKKIAQKALLKDPDGALWLISRSLRILMAMEMLSEATTQSLKSFASNIGVPEPIFNSLAEEIRVSVQAVRENSKEESKEKIRYLEFQDLERRRAASLLDNRMKLLPDLNKMNSNKKNNEDSSPVIVEPKTKQLSGTTEAEEPGREID